MQLEKFLYKKYRICIQQVVIILLSCVRGPCYLLFHAFWSRKAVNQLRQQHYAKHVWSTYVLCVRSLSPTQIIGDWKVYWKFLLKIIIMIILHFLEPYFRSYSMLLDIPTYRLFMSCASSNLTIINIFRT